MHLGGPELCQDCFPSNFTFDENSSPRINVTIYGAPQPKVQAEFNGQVINVRNETLNTYTHNFTLELPRLTQAACGKELKMTITGNNRTLTNKTKIFPKDCKYAYYFHLFLF